MLCNFQYSVFEVVIPSFLKRNLPYRKATILQTTHSDLPVEGESNGSEMADCRRFNNAPRRRPLQVSHGVSYQLLEFMQLFHLRGK